MNQSIRRVRRNRRTFFNSQILIAVTGIMLSIVLHELFHVALHWGNIIKVALFPDYAAIVAITSYSARGYTPQIEEAVAYGITLLTMLATVAIISYRSDKHDTRSFAQTVFPRDEAMQQLNSRELYELAIRINLV